MPAVEDRAAVDGDEIALGEDVVRRRDAVHDAIVDRRADRPGEAVVPEERRHGAGVTDHRFGDPVEFQSADTGLRRIAHRDQCGDRRSRRQPPSRRVHRRCGTEPPCACARNPCEHPTFTCRARRSARALTSSTSPMASTVTIASRVVVEQRSRLVAVDLEAVADDVLGVVGTATGEHALDHDVLVDDEGQHSVELGVEILQDLLECLGLLDRCAGSRREGSRWPRPARRRGRAPCRW